MGQPNATTGNLEATMPYSLRCWLELHNPITPQTPSEQAVDPMGMDMTHGGYRANLEENVRLDPNMAMPKAPQSAYRILIYQVPVGPGGGGDPIQQQMQDPTNTPGIPTMPAQPMGWPKVVDFSDAMKATANGNKVVMPNVGAQIDNAGGKTFYLLGPSHDAMMGMGNAELPPVGSGTQADLTHAELSLEVPNMETDGGNQINWVPAFILQRLADPYSRGGNQVATDPSSPPVDPTNPYVTIDYLNPDMTRVSIYDRLQFFHNGMRPANMQPDLNTTFSWGRRQPYDARIAYTDQNHYRQGGSNPPGAMGQIGAHTFAKHNAQNGTWPAAAAAGSQTDQNPGTLTNDTLQFPFLPLNHLDRIVISPMELLHVTAVKPHELTHSFFLTPETPPPPAPPPPPPAPGVARRLAYTANWLDEPDTFLSTAANRSTFLFRALDFLRTSTNMDGVSLGSRVPGKVNLNTQYTATEILEAVADPSPANRFTNAHVGAAWNAFINNTLGTGIRPTNGQFNGNDRPLHGLATAVSRAGVMSGMTGLPDGDNSQDRTLARMGGLWQRGANSEDVQIGTMPGAGGSAEKFELLNKTFNQFTTRSNVFAVYMTIGYFEVMNDGPYNEQNRPVLGKEMGTDDGAIVRHRFFSIVDRTNLMIEPPVPQLGPSPFAAPTAKQGAAPVFLEYQPSVPLPDASNGFQVNPDPILAPIPALGWAGMPNVPARIPAQSQVLGAQPPYPPNKPIRLSGFYDGNLWTIWDDPANTVNLGGIPQPVTRAILGSGATAEAVIIRLPPNSFDPSTGSATIIIEADNPPPPVGTGNGMFRFQHHRGEALRIVNPDPLATAFWSTLLNPAVPAELQILLQLQRNASVPGNPGPQAGFQYRASRFTPVVRYAEQLK